MGTHKKNDLRRKNLDSIELVFSYKWRESTYLDNTVWRQLEECEMVMLRSNFVTSFARSGNLKSLKILIIARINLVGSGGGLAYGSVKPKLEGVRTVVAQIVQA